MKLAFSLHALVLAFYTVVLIVFPASYLALYGVTLSPVAEVVVRFLGGLAAGNAMLSWSIRDEPASTALNAIKLAFVFDWLVILVAGVLGQLSGAMNALGWSTVVLALVWILVFGYFRFVRA